MMVPYIDDAGLSLLSLLLEVLQQVSSAKNIKIHRDLIQKQHLQGGKVIFVEPNGLA